MLTSVDRVIPSVLVAWLLALGASACVVEDDANVDAGLRALVVVQTNTDCAAFDTALDLALQNASPNDIIEIKPPLNGNVYKTCVTHDVPSDIVIRGVPPVDPKDYDTLILQTSTDTTIFEVDQQSNVTIQHLYLAGDKTSNLIVVYGSSDVTIHENYLNLGYNAIYLADEPSLARNPALTCSAGASNTNVTISGNIFRGTAAYGVAARNLANGTIRENHGDYGGVKLDMLKFSCGPVTGNSIEYNYLFNSTQGDGLDAAFLSTKRVDPADGEFKDNTIAHNIAHDNELNGLGFKSGNSGSDYRFCPEELLFELNIQVGTNSLSNNFAFDNGAGEIAIQESNPYDENCLDNLAVSEKTQVRHNVAWDSDGVPPGGEPSVGVGLHQSFNVYLADNWIGGHDQDGIAPCDTTVPTDSDCEVFLSGNYLATGGSPVDRRVAIEDNYLDNGFIGLAAAVQSPNPTGSLAPTQANMVTTLDTHVFDGYHCEDRDGDGCPNGCEEMFGADPLDDQSTPSPLPTGGPGCLDSVTGITCGGVGTDLCAT